MDVENQPPAYMQPPRRVRRPRRGFNQSALIAWLDEQERLIRRRGVPTEVVQEFDPLQNLPEPPEDEQGRRTLLFLFDDNLESSIADQINRKIVENVKSRFKLKLTSWVELRNVEDNSTMDFYNQDVEPSPWFETLAAAQAWAIQQEEVRLEPGNQRRPNTKWVYERTKRVYVKVILDRHPLFLGLGRLPDWLRNKRRVVSLDSYQDNRCLFRCIAVHWGADVRRNMRKTRELEKSFFSQRPGLRNRQGLRNAVFQYYGCHWHGCKQCYQKPFERQEVVRRDKQGRLITRKVAYGLTLQRAKHLREAGYTVVEKWEHEEPTPWAAIRGLEKQTETYPHAIVYDFESYQDTSKAARPTRDLLYESEHVPISVSIADTLNPEPEYIVSQDPAELIQRFYQSLERRHAAIVADVAGRYFPADTEGIPISRGNLIMQWIAQVPVLGLTLATTISSSSASTSSRSWRKTLVSSRRKRTGASCSSTRPSSSSWMW